jgi:hypothetical protein
MYNENDKQSLELYSSAVTLSDMEVFIFPQLLYALNLANIMSPRLWAWKKDSWFEGLEKKNPQQRIQRLKQYIMDHFSFNLDLDTWGLTKKDMEIDRFSAFIDPKILSESNALFGYEGDKYYFDIDIRRHFGLDKYNSDIIPYWKTETLEAMEAFKYKDGYPTGAGECVSLAALYASSAFAVAGLPLDSIFMLATPLHSQNFLNIGDGILTNNRRIVTKTMWFNGTELTAKARRAIENEKITIVAHNTGYIHTVYNRATISQNYYHNFRDKLKNYLKTNITFDILANFLRQNSKLQRCFQISHICCGKPRFIEAEKVFHYEHSSKFRVGDTTQNNLLHEIEEDEFYTAPLQGRMMLSELEHYFKENKVPVDVDTTIEKLKNSLCHNCFNVDDVIKDLTKFCRIIPRMPELDKDWQKEEIINLDHVHSAQEALDRIVQIRDKNESADLAFSAYRDLTRSPWKPFLKAAFERNPVTLAHLNGQTIDEMYTKIQSFENVSIYDEPYRLAQPDEVWNYGRGDGIEKAILLANLIRNNFKDESFTLDQSSKKAQIKFRGKEFIFNNSKEVPTPLEKDFVW